MDHIEYLEKLKADAYQKIEKASTNEDLEGIRVEYLGRKGKLTDFMRNLGEIPQEDRPQAGKTANTVKNGIENLLEIKPEDIHKTNVMLAMVNGKVVHEEGVDWEVVEPGGNYDVFGNFY